MVESNCKLPVGLTVGLLLCLAAAIFFGIYWSMGKQISGFPKKKKCNTEGIHIEISEDMNEDLRELIQNFIYTMQYTNCKSPDLIKSKDDLVAMLNEFEINDETTCSDIKNFIKSLYDDSVAKLKTQEEKDAAEKVFSLYNKLLDILCNNNDDTKISIQTVTVFFNKIFDQVCPIKDLEEYDVYDLNVLYNRRSPPPSNNNMSQDEFNQMLSDDYGEN